MSAAQTRQGALTPAETPDHLPRRRELIDLESWTPAELQALVERAAYMRAALADPTRRFEALRGLLVVTLFYENSTRTRVSFELAARRMGADVASVSASSSSVTKGESLRDTCGHEIREDDLKPTRRQVMASSGASTQAQQ